MDLVDDREEFRLVGVTWPEERLLSPRKLFEPEAAAAMWSKLSFEHLLPPKDRLEDPPFKKLPDLVRTISVSPIMVETYSKIQESWCRSHWSVA